MMLSNALKGNDKNVWFFFLVGLGVVFGSDDYCASIGATRTADDRGLQYARQKVVVTAKAYQLQAIDKVYIDYKDHEGVNLIDVHVYRIIHYKQCILQ